MAAPTHACLPAAALASVSPGVAFYRPQETALPLAPQPNPLELVTGLGVTGLRPH